MEGEGLGGGEGGCKVVGTGVGEGGWLHAEEFEFWVGLERGGEDGCVGRGGAPVEKDYFGDGGMCLPGRKGC